MVSYVDFQLYPIPIILPSRLFHISNPQTLGVHACNIPPPPKHLFPPKDRNEQLIQGKAM